MLVVVHHGDVALLLEPALYLEALRGLDVLEVDASEGGGYGLDGGDEFLRILLVQLYVVAVQSSEYLEQKGLPLHHGLAGEGSDVAQTEDGRAVGDDGHEIALVGVFVGVFRAVLDLQAGVGHAGRIGQGKVVLGRVGFGGQGLYLARTAETVIVQGRFLIVV